MNKKRILLLLASFLPFFSYAHEGHGHTDGYTITHYFVEPEHLVVNIIAFTAVIVTYRYFRKREKGIEE